MAVFERETRVAAPLETVWRFHSSVDGLAALTPEWLGFEVIRVEGPDGEPDPDVLEEGSTVELSVRPFGRGPRQRWRSVIEERTETETSAVFRDRMADGPFDAWEHTHQFEAVEGGTVIRDRVEYELRDVPLGGVVDRLAVVGLAPMFRHRHRETRRLLEEGDWNGWD